VHLQTAHAPIEVGEARCFPQVLQTARSPFLQRDSERPSPQCIDLSQRVPCRYAHHCGLVRDHLDAFCDATRLPIPRRRPVFYAATASVHLCKRETRWHLIEAGETVEELTTMTMLRRLPDALR
jgi:hypothetical protein